MRDHRFVVLGGEPADDDWFRSRGLRADHDLQNLASGKCTVVIWDAVHLTPAVKQQAAVLREFAAAGGRILVLATRSWDWTELCDIRIGDARGSRAFPYPDAKHSLLADLRTDWLTRWNGLPGVVVIGSLDGPAMAQARKILWVREPKICAAAEVPIAGGKGAILFSQLDIQRRANRSKPDYDPVAERVLMNMLQETQ